MSELLLRELSQECAKRISSSVHAAVAAVIDRELPGILQTIISEKYPGETLRIYGATRPAAHRRDRNQAIRAKYNGHNVKALAKEFGMSPRMVFKIVNGGK